MIDGTSLQPANCPAFFSALLTGAPTDRSFGFVQKEIIRRVDKDLLKIPINPQPLTAATRQVLGRIKRRIKESVEQAVLRPAANSAGASASVPVKQTRQKVGFEGG